MRAITLLSLAGLAFTLACTSKVSSDSTTNYIGTAAAGDVVRFSRDATKSTLGYQDLTNSLSASGLSAPVATDGTLTFSDATGFLLNAEEAPGAALVAIAQKAGAGENQLSLVTAVPSAPITPASIQGLKMNFLQMGTTGGGIRMGTLTSDMNGTVEATSCQPYAVLLGGSNSFLAQGGFTSATQGMAADLLTVQDTSGSFTPGTLFGDPARILAMASASGSVLAFPKAADLTLPASSAGTYHAIIYRKTGANIAAPGTVETGTVAAGVGTITVGVQGADQGDFTVVDANGTPVLGIQSWYLQNAATAFGLPWPGQTDLCQGLFGFYAAPLQANPEFTYLFVAFPSDGTVVFCAFIGHEDQGTGQAALYDYAYGVGYH